jgi:hypothetical protein
MEKPTPTGYYISMLENGFAYSDEISDFIDYKPEETYAWELSQYPLRRNFTKQISWCLLSLEVIEAVKKLDVPIVSVGCGSGFIEAAFRKYGIDVIATNAHRPTKNPYEFATHWIDDIKYLPGSTAVKKYSDRAVFMSWPCYKGYWATNVLKAISEVGRYFIYIGEDYGGCNATNSFFDILSHSFFSMSSPPIPQWSGIHDYCTIYQKKE